MNHNQTGSNVVVCIAWCGQVEIGPSVSFEKVCMMPMVRVS